MANSERSPHYAEAERIQSECSLNAVFVKAPGEFDIRIPLYQSAIDSQHRAEGSAGMLICNRRGRQNCVRELGKVEVAFQEGSKLPLVKDGHIGIVHLRYPTSGNSGNKANIQPLSIDGLSLGHHGNLTNALQIKERLNGCLSEGEDSPNSDSWIALNAIAATNRELSLSERVIIAKKGFEGSWALVVTDGKTLVASRDPNGIRPFFLGYFGSSADPRGYFLSVESCVYKNLGITDFREILPGETIEISDLGEKTVNIDSGKQMSCIFEFIYMMHPKSEFLGKNIYEARRESGRILWKESPVELEHGEELIVMPVPNSGRPAALGYFKEAQRDLGLRVTYDEGILSNAHFGRNFIKPANGRAADLKFYTIPNLFKNSTVALIDDSIVRGDTLRSLISMCREAGVKRIHARSASPPIKNPCSWGVAMQSYQELLANLLPEIESRKRFLNVDSLGYLSLGGLTRAIGVDGDKFCTYCLDGNGPKTSVSNRVMPLFEGKHKVDKPMVPAKIL